MKKSYVLKTLGLFFLCLLLAYSGFLLSSVKWQKSEPKIAHLVEKVVYISGGQNASAAAIRVEVEVMDDVKKPSGQVLSVEFAGHNIPLKPPDPTGRRGTAFLQLPPGKYPLRWQLKNSEGGYPSSQSFEKTIQINGNEIGVYLLVKGDQLFFEGENK